MSLLHDTHTSEAPEAFLDQQGTVFARFGIDTQDSGNISYGVQVDDRRFFVKTASAPSDVPAVKQTVASEKTADSGARAAPSAACSEGSSMLHA